MCQQPESYSALPGPEKLEVLLALLRQAQTGLLLIKDTGDPLQGYCSGGVDLESCEVASVYI